jgi:hypothetical protein
MFLGIWTDYVAIDFCRCRRRYFGFAGEWFEGIQIVAAWCRGRSTIFVWVMEVSGNATKRIGALKHRSLLGAPLDLACKPTALALGSWMDKPRSASAFA